MRTDASFWAIAQERDEAIAARDHWFEAHNKLSGYHRALREEHETLTRQWVEAIAERDKAREALKERQTAIDSALSQLEGSAYVGGPTEREAFRAAMEALGPFRTEHRGQGEAPS